MSLSAPFETGLVFDPALSVLYRSLARSEMLFWKRRWVGVVLGMGLCNATIYMRLKNSNRRYCFVAGYPLAVRDCLFTRVSVHDSVFDFPHRLIHSWPRERSSAIRNLRPARLPQLGYLGTISLVPQPRENRFLVIDIFGTAASTNLMTLDAFVFLVSSGISFLFVGTYRFQFELLIPQHFSYYLVG